MKIGMDLDEVIADFMESYLQFHHNETGRLYSKESILSYHNLWTYLESTKEELTKLMYRFIEHHAHDTPLVQHAGESIVELSKRHELSVITARPSSLRDKTENYLARNLNGLPLELHFASDFFKGQGRSKAELCNSLGISIFIEDSGEYALNCARSGVKTLLFDRPWNQNYRHQNIVRVSSWPAALKEIEIFENQKI